MSDKPQWDSKKAEEMIGKLVLIGVTHNEPGGPRQEQMFGRIKSADQVSGFKIALEGSRAGTVYGLPPHIDAFSPAKPGEYRLKSTGEVVVDPDFTTTWEVNPPAAKNNSFARFAL